MGGPVKTGVRPRTCRRSAEASPWLPTVVCMDLIGHANGEPRTLPLRAGADGETNPFGYAAGVLSWLAIAPVPATSRAEHAVGASEDPCLMAYGQACMSVPLLWRVERLDLVADGQASADRGCSPSGGLPELWSATGRRSRRVRLIRRWGLLQLGLPVFLSR